MAAPVLTDLPLIHNRFGSKACEAPNRDRSEAARLGRLRARFATEGTRRSVAAILVVHAHRHPHVLLLQDLSSSNQNPSSSSSSSPSFSLPGGRLRPGEDEVSGLARKLRARLSAPPPQSQGPGAPQLAHWDVPRERAGLLFRPAFSRELYPYCPAHVAIPKEEISIRIVPLPEKLSFAVPEGFRLVAVPLMELHAAAAAAAAIGGVGSGGIGSRIDGDKFGAAAAAAPALLSRLALSLAAASASAPKVGLPPPDDGRMWKREKQPKAKELGEGGEEDEKALVVAGGGGGGQKREVSPAAPPMQEEEEEKEEGKEEEEEEEEELEDLEEEDEEEEAGGGEAS